MKGAFLLVFCLAFLTSILTIRVTNKKSNDEEPVLIKQSDWEQVYGPMSEKKWARFKQREKEREIVRGSLKRTRFQDWIAYPYVQNLTYDPWIQQIIDSVDENHISDLMYNLTNKFFTRQAESSEAEKAALFIEDQYISLGLKTELHRWREDYSPNVIGFLEGQDPMNVIVISGHYDCRQVGLYDNSSRAPGADDNASGATMVLEVARVLSNFARKRLLRYSVHFLSSSGEEQFLLGADAYGRRLKRERKNVVANINADMISYLSSGELPMIAMIPNTWGGRETTTDWLNELSLNVSGIYLKQYPRGFADDGICCSDQEAFVDLGFPGISFFERIGKRYTDNPYYHTINDAIGKGSNSMTSIGLVSKAVLATTSSFAWL